MVFEPIPINRSPAAADMVLRSTRTSPFGRKVRIAADVLGLNDRIERVQADTLDPADTLRLQNPLGKMPCLLLGDGTVLFDSRVIIEYLDTLSDRRVLIPPSGLPRFHALTLAALADGIADAALLVVYERRFRPLTRISTPWLEHQKGKIHRGLMTFEAAPPDPARTDVASIGLACTLGYLDWRNPVNWRSRYPALVAWLDRFAALEPAFGRTAADDRR